MAILLLSIAHIGGFHIFLWRADTQEVNLATIQKKRVMKWDENGANHISPAPLVADPLDLSQTLIHTHPIKYFLLC